MGTADSEPDHLKVGLPKNVDYEGYQTPNEASNLSSVISSGNGVKPVNQSDISGSV